MQLRVASTVVLAVLVLAGCGTSTANTAAATATSRNSTTKDIAAGRLDGLPSGNLFERVLEFDQDPGTSFGSEAHQQGIVFVASGQQSLHIETDPAIILKASQGIFQPNRTHVHENSGSTRNHWYFLSLWPSAARGKPLVNPAAKVVYQTQDAPASALQGASYTETLRLVEIDSGGRTGAAKFGGLLMVFVLDGSVQLHVAGQQPASVAAGQGAFVLPGVAVQAFSQNGPSHLLLFFATATGEPFETAVPATP